MTPNTVLHTWWVLPTAMPDIVRSLKSGAVIDRGWLVDWREHYIPMRKLSCATVLALVRFGVIKQHSRHARHKFEAVRE